MTIQVIIAYSLLLQLVLAVSNLIINPDFQGNNLTISLSGQYYDGLIDLRPNWYPKYILTSVEIRTLDLIDLNQWLDIKNSVLTGLVCQTVELVADAKHTLLFDYALADGIVEANVSISLNGIEFIETVTQPLGKLSNIFYGSLIEQTNEICFDGTYNPSGITGILIDNLQLVMKERIEYIHFIIEPINQKLYAFGNYTILPQQLDKFKEGKISYGNRIIVGGLVFLSNSTITIVFNLEEPFDPSENITLSFEDVEYIDSDFVFIDFVPSYEISEQNATQTTNSTNITQTTNSTNTTQTTNSTNTTQTKNNTNATQIINDQGKKSTDSNDEVKEQDAFLDFFYSTDFSFLQNGATGIKNAQSVMIGFLVTSFLFKFINFANIMVLYIFLDIALLDATVRTVFENFAAILLKDGAFSSLYSLISGSSPDINLSLDIPERIPYEKTNGGSPYSIIELTTNIMGLCLEDTALILFNGVKILISYLVIKKIKSNKFIKENKRILEQKFKKAFYIEIISVSPMWMLAAGISINYFQISNLAYRTFKEKINLVVLLFLPFLMLSGALGWGMVKIGQLINIETTTDKKIKMLERINRKKEEQKLRRETNLEWFGVINYMIFGFLIGAFPTLVVLSVVTLYKSGNWWYLLKTIKKTKYYVLQLIRISIESIIHLGFLILFIVDQVSANQLDLLVIKASKYISILILYAYIGGCLVEIVIFIVEIFIDLRNMVHFFCGNEDTKIGQVKDRQDLTDQNQQIQSLIKRVNQKKEDELATVVKNKQDDINQDKRQDRKQKKEKRQSRKEAKRQNGKVQKKEVSKEGQKQAIEEGQKQASKEGQRQASEEEQKQGRKAEKKLPKIKFPENWEPEETLYIATIDMGDHQKSNNFQEDEVELYFNENNILCLDQMGRQKAKREEEQMKNNQMNNEHKDQKPKKPLKIKVKNAKKLKQDGLKVNYPNIRENTFT